MKLLILAGVPLFIAVVLGIASAVHMNFLIAFIWLCIGVWITAAVVFGYFDSLLNPIFLVSSALIGALTIFSAFYYSNAANFPLQSAYSEAMKEFSSLGAVCTPITQPLYQLEKRGIAACAMQGSIDLMDLVVNLFKALYYGPTMSLIDGVLSISNGEIKNQCALAFVDAEKLCKNPFPFMTEDVRQLLRDKAK